MDSKKKCQEWNEKSMVYILERKVVRNVKSGVKNRLYVNIGLMRWRQKVSLT